MGVGGASLVRRSSSFPSLSPLRPLPLSGIEDVDVTMIDALPDPTGGIPYLSSTGKPVEAGTRGFWKVRILMSLCIKRVFMNMKTEL